MRTILLTINAAVFIAAFAPIAAACDDVAPSPASAVYIPVIAPTPDLTPSQGAAQSMETRSVVSASAAPLPQMPRAAQKERVVQLAPLDNERRPEAALTRDAGLWADVLKNHAYPSSDGLLRFDYAGLQASAVDTANLAKYIKHLSGQTPSTMARNEAMAYWANLYNALTVQVVAQNYPMGSIRDIKSGGRKGPWRRKLVTIEGKMLTLDNIEHDIMRPTFNTPLVHYMVNCASIGCPNLKAVPWQAQTLDADLAAAARAYINSPRGVKILGGKVSASKIYKWFKKDFGNNAAGVLAHMRRYANADLRNKLDGHTKIDKYTYDWGVNAP